MQAERFEPLANALSPEQLEARLAGVPRIPLAVLPTPLEECPRLGAALGILLYVKRDDLTGLAFGGNKVRGAEFRLADVVQQGADTLVMAREPDSNNARVTIAACRKLGLDVVLIVPEAWPGQWQGSLLIDRLCGADVRFVAGGPAAVDAARQGIMRELCDRGKRPIDHDAGDSARVLATVSYVSAALELQRQCAQYAIRPDWLFVVSEGATQAGLVTGAQSLGLAWKIVGVTYGERPGDQRPGIAGVARAAATLLGLEAQPTDADIISLGDYAGPAFKALTEEARQAIQLAASTEGLLLDPIYTGKGMAALRDQVRRGVVAPGATVVFVHTGGLPALFRYGDELVAAG